VAAHLVLKKLGRLEEERGQAIVIMAVFLSVLLGMTALAIDVGSWYRAQRALQARVDAAALAGAQELPYDTAAATSVAGAYGTRTAARSRVRRSRSRRARFRKTRSRW
jgi:uncharacterized membrane protein